MRIHATWTGIIMMTFLQGGWTQVVDNSCLYAFTLSDEIKVNVVRGFNDESSHTYYYLPANLKLSVKKDKTPEFSFLTYNTGDGKEISGAILHMLFSWGLTPEQEKEVEKKLHSSVDSNAVLAGVISLEVPDNVPGFRFTGENEWVKILNTKWSQEPMVSVIPETKMALSYRFNAEEAKKFQEALTQTSKLNGIAVELTFTYRGGNRQQWYNLIKGDNYILKADLKDILKPVLNEKKK